MNHKFHNRDSIKCIEKVTKRSTPMVGQTLRKTLFFLLNSKLLMDPISWKNYLSKDINYTFLSEKKVGSNLK